MSDSSEYDAPRPSGSRSRQIKADQKRKRIVMRIEFDDSDEETSSSVASAADDIDNQPTCSSRLRSSKMLNQLKKNQNHDDDDSSEEFLKNAAKRLHHRRKNVFGLDGSSSDNSSSGSEITRVKTRGKIFKNGVVSEDENDWEKFDTPVKPLIQQTKDEPGFHSDSSSNESLEKCPICLLTFRQQEIGTPSTCEHIFCANCIEAWSKNVQTCPIDRLEFAKIIVRASYENRRFVREIIIDTNSSKKELVLDDDVVLVETNDADDVTNCEICSSSEREDVMLLCDSCNDGYHIDCLTPPLIAIPEGSWYCDNCFDSQDEDDEVEDDLTMLYEDIRNMGIPESRLRVTEVLQPRILRTRQNERIRAAVLRRTRAAIAQNESTVTTTTTNERRARGLPRDATTTTTTTTTTTQTTRTRSRSTKAVRKPRKRRRRRARQRTYVVEYDLNNFDEKFAIKTTKKIIRRRRRKQRRSSRAVKSVSVGSRRTASKRLVEQMGIKHDTNYSSQLPELGGGASFSLFGNANDLEYFSDSDPGEVERGGNMETGHGTAVQTAVRFANIGPRRAHKGLLLGRLENGVRSVAAALPMQAPITESTDLLSSIIDMQERWHNANMQKVHINSDGTLNLPRSEEDKVDKGTDRKPDNEKTKSQNPNPNDVVTQAPMYKRGGGNNPNFSSGGGGGSSGSNSGGYNNRYRNQNNYRGNSGSGGGNSSVGNNQYRHSTGGSSNNCGGDGDNRNFNNTIGPGGNFNFSSPNYNASNNQNANFSPFNIRFTPRNQQNNNANNSEMLNNPIRRNSLSFSSNQQNQNFNQQHQQQQQHLSQQNQPFDSRSLHFSGPPPPTQPHQLSQLPPQHDTNMLYSGMPPMTAPPPAIHGPPPPNIPSGIALNIAPLLSVPPPPAPPPGVHLPWNTSLFQLTTDYGNDDDDSNCPNFSVYSAESQEVAKASTTANKSESSDDAPKEDDENEDLVQLDDDDDDIPMPPDSADNVEAEKSDLYEPENPTENDEEEFVSAVEGDNSELNLNSKEDNDSNDDGVNKVIDDADDDKKNLEKNDENSCYDPEHETVSETNNNNDQNLNKWEKDDDKNTKSNEEVPSIAASTQNRRTPSPTISETKMPGSATKNANRKGVLELYDDSDWEELDIDKPKEYETKTVEKEKETDKVTDELTSEDRTTAAVNEQVEVEQDRSYTPCLDEHNEPEEVDRVTPAIGSRLSTGSNQIDRIKDKQQQNDKESIDAEDAVSIVAAIDAELLSDEEANNRNNRNKRRTDKREKRNKNENVEPFKKVSHKQKERNYRSDKHPTNKRNSKRRSSYSRSKSNSRSPRTKTLSRTNSFTRSKSHSSRSRSKSRSWSRGRSRSRSPRTMNRFRRQPRFLQSPNRNSFNQKENQNWRQQSRGRGSNFVQPRWSNNRQQQNRPKRREMPRYDVRNVVGTQRSNNYAKDRYGRDESRQMRSRSVSLRRRQNSFSGSPSRSVTPPQQSRRQNRRFSFSMSPSPTAPHHRQTISPRRFHSPISRRNSSSPVRISNQRHNLQSPISIRSRSITPRHKMNGRKVVRRLRGEPSMTRPQVIRSRSLSVSPRYTPHLSKSRSKSLKTRQKGKKRKPKERKKKKTKKQAAAIVTPEANRRIARQQDPFDIDKPSKKKRRHLLKTLSTHVETTNWSPSPSPPPPAINYDRDNNVSWTPPIAIASPQTEPELGEIREPNIQRSISKEKRKRIKKKKKTEKRRDIRKEKRRQHRTETPEPIPSKEVFASGNNILVSVNFNKEATANQQQQQSIQTTVVTVPPNREGLLTNRRISMDVHNSSIGASKKKKDKSHKRKKLDAKPVAIIDLERSPFQVHQEPADIIVLTDSDDGNNEHQQRQHSHEHERHHNESLTENSDHHCVQMGNTGRVGSHHDKTPSMERLNTILETSYDMPQTGPKTPPEPPIIKFNIQSKKQNKPRPNMLLDESDIPSETETNEREQDEEEVQGGLHHRQEIMETMQVQQVVNTNVSGSVSSTQKIGPNTPPESGPCSPDAYDPFEPTKSPSLSPRSPTPPPLDTSQQTSLRESADEMAAPSHGIDEQRLSGERVVHQMQSTSTSSVVGNSSSLQSQQTQLNAVELVMALMSSKSNTTQEISNKSKESQFMMSSHSSHDDNLTMRDKADESNGLTVLSNVLISTSSQQQNQHIPSISSPMPIAKSTQILKLPLPKVGGSVGSSSGLGLPQNSGNMRNGGADESFTINEFDSPYSPGSADYEDLFEPPPDTNNTKRRNKRSAPIGSGKAEVFDNLFGSTSPVGHLRLPSFGPSNKKYRPGVTVAHGNRKPKIKVGKSNDHDITIYDDVPNSAVELQVKDKFLRKLNRQERVVEEVKLVLKPRFNKKQITKEEYKEIMRRAVPKICHSRSGEINPNKIKNLIDAYVKKFRAKHKFNIINTGQVSSAVKCAAYLKKL